MSKINRRRFLLLGLLAFLGVVLAACWRVLGRFLFPGTEVGPGAVPEGRDAPGDGEQKPGRTREREAAEREDGPAADPEPGDNGFHGREAGPEHDQAGPSAGLESAWKRSLGKTGFEVSIFGLGGGGIIARAERKDQAMELIEHALEAGVNFIDTAPTYGSGASERHIGEALQKRREAVFLATKTLDRTYDGTMRQVERSLENLRTGTLDLYQVHGIRDHDDAESIFQEGGVMQAMEQLKQEGVVRHIGITGHRSPGPLRFVMERFHFDCVLIPLNPAEVHFQSFQEGLLPYALQKQVGVVAMKVPAYGRLLREGGIASMQQALRYVYTLPISTAIVGLSSLEELAENVGIAREFTPCSPAEMKRLEELAQPYQEEANFFKVEW